MLQSKFLARHARNNGWPGVAVALGALAPAGYGPFKPPGWSGFAYLALTESLWDEWLLVHSNVGFAIGDDGESVSSVGTLGSDRVRTLMTGGIGAQARMVAGLHGVAEVYYGDPYDPRFGHPALQVGFRYIFGEHVQVDGTFGSTLRSAVAVDGHVQTEQWGTVGLRLVSPELW